MCYTCVQELHRDKRELEAKLEELEQVGTLPRGEQYIETIQVGSVGGSEDATFIHLHGGAVIVLAFNIVGVYASEDDYWGDQEGNTKPLWLSDEGLAVWKGLRR
jgi:hypothetical protein